MNSTTHEATHEAFTAEPPISLLKNLQVRALASHEQHQLQPLGPASLPGSDQGRPTPRAFLARNPRALPAQSTHPFPGSRQEPLPIKRPCCRASRRYDYEHINTKKYWSIGCGAGRRDFARAGLRRRSADFKEQRVFRRDVRNQIFDSLALAANGGRRDLRGRCRPDFVPASCQHPLTSRWIHLGHGQVPHHRLLRQFC